MKDKKILICDSIDELGVEILRKSEYHVDVEPNITSTDLLKKVAGYEALIVRSRTKITKEILHAGKKLVVVARSGVGLDNIDVEEAKKLNIQVVNSAEAPSNSVAELVIGYILSLARNIPKADSSMKNGLWIKNKLTGFEIKGKTIGIVGFGRIGYLVGKKARALGMRVLAYDVVLEKIIHLTKEIDVEASNFEKILEESDFISIHVPLLPSTTYMFNSLTLGKMKKGSYIINAARGKIIEEKALLEAIKSGHIAGAALDVYEEEPTQNMELIKLDNVICTPHIGAESKEAQLSNSTIIADKIKNILG
ncbi:hydroxyacid dehydrogenase [Candidatus Bathyarchaeota archaeon]|nr:hydroxyacid dehydrogenase [Candidatus Bathyarchaeota archaeon]